MSATYTLHVSPYASPGDAEALDGAALVRDAFSWGAFLVPMLWFFRHGHVWLGLAALAAVIALAAGLHLAGVAVPAIVGAEIVLHLLIGLEGSSLRRWAYARRGRPAVDVVSAGDYAEAESKSFGRWLQPRPAEELARPGRLRTAPDGRREEPVIGLFPEPRR